MYFEHYNSYRRGYHGVISDVLGWDESERAELIAGEVFLMAPAPSRVHQRISGEVFRQIANYLEGKKYVVYHAPFDVRLFEKDGDTPEAVDTVVEPDITVVCDTSKLDDCGCKGAPSGPL